MAIEFESRPVEVIESVSAAFVRSLVQSREFRSRVLRSIGTTKKTNNEGGFVVFKVFGQEQLAFSDVTMGTRDSWKMNYESNVRSSLPPNYPLLFVHTHPGGRQSEPTHLGHDGGSDHRNTLEGLLGEITIDLRRNPSFRTLGMAIAVNPKSNNIGYAATLWTNDMAWATLIHPEIIQSYSLGEKIRAKLGKLETIEESLSRALFAERFYNKKGGKLLALWFAGNFYKISSLSSTKPLSDKDFERFNFKSKVGLFY